MNIFFVIKAKIAVLITHYTGLPNYVDFINIIQIHNNGMWDWQYFAEYSHIQAKCGKYSTELIMSVPQNIVMDMNYIMNEPRMVVLF
jgi:hypothetical protein